MEFTARIGAAFGDRAAADWQRLWRRAARVWNASSRDILRRTVDSPRDLASLAWRVGDLAAIAPGRSLRGLGRRHLSDPRLRMLLDRYATYTGADPRRAPAALVAVPYAELTFGGWYLRGGLGTLADALLTRCLDLGVVVQTDATVTRIDATGGRVHGVRLAGVTAPVPADVVVANVDALTVYRDLLPHPRRLAALTDRSLAGFVLLLGVSGSTGLAHHNVFFPDDYDAEFDAVFGDPGRGVRARPAADPTVFVTVADDPMVRPAGHEAWFVLVNAARQGTAAGAVDWRRPGWPTRTPTGSWTCWRGAAWTCATGCCSVRSAPPPTWTWRPARQAARSTAPPVGCSARPTGARRTGCGWWVAPPTRAAGCRW